jgi:hypothetical protein
VASGHRMQPQPDKYLISQTVAAVVALGDSVGFSVIWAPYPLHTHTRSTSYIYNAFQHLLLWLVASIMMQLHTDTTKSKSIVFSALNTGFSEVRFLRRTGFSESEINVGTHSHTYIRYIEGIQSHSIAVNRPWVHYVHSMSLPCPGLVPLTGNWVQIQITPP